MAGNTLPMQVSLTENEVNKAASEFLTMSSERRKRSRASVTNPAELARKRSGNQPINVESARKSALSLMQESASFKRLVELEEQLDLAIMRKQQAIREVLKADTYSESRIFRLYIFNSYRSQPGAEGVTPDDVASWSLRIQGKLLPKGETGSSDNSVPPAAFINDPAANPGSAHARASGVAAAGTSGINNTSANNNNNCNSGTAGANAAGSGGGNVGSGNAVGSGGGATTTNIGGQTGSSSNSGAYGAAAGTGGGSGGEGPGIGSGGGANNAGVAGHEGTGGDAQQQPQQTSVITGEEPRCSDVFNRIVVELDKETYGKDNVIEWKRNERDNASDGFEISRPGNKEFIAKIFLFVDHKPTRYRLSNELSQLIGTRYETKSGVFSSIWQYVKKHRLQCVDNRAAVRLDPGLKTLLGTNKTTTNGASLEFVKAQSLFALLKNHMGPLDPLKIEYEVRLAGDVVDNQDCYDIHVNVSDMSMIESARKAGVFGLPLSHSSEFEALNERHLQALERIAHHKKRRDFFEGFCGNPVQFINHLILSQTRDLKVLGGSTGRNPEEERHAMFYQQQWVHEAVPRYLLRKAIADTAEDTTESGLKSQQ